VLSSKLIAQKSRRDRVGPPGVVANVEGQFVVPSNLLELYPSVTVEPFAGLSIGVGWDFLWRESTQDAIYGPPFLAYRRTAQSTGRPVGNQFVAEALWEIDRRFRPRAFRPDRSITAGSSS